MVHISEEGKELVHLFISSILGVTDYKLSDQVKRTIFQEISRLVEVENTIRDGWGNWDWQYCESQLDGKLYVPWIDRLIVEHQEIKQPLWPDHKRFALCLSHDVDDVTHLTPLKAYRMFLRNIQWMRKASPGVRKLLEILLKDLWIILMSVLKPSKQQQWIKFEEWIRIEDQYGFHSTFFFLPTNLIKPHIYDPVYHYHDVIPFENRNITVQKLMQVLEDYGWEIGLHGSYHSALEPGLLKSQKQQLEKALGKEVISTRQHWLHYDVNTTPILQAEAGFRVDSTQGFNRSIGFRAGTSFPYYCWDHQNQKLLPILEIPQHIMDGSLFTLNALEYNEQFAIRHCIRLMDEVEAVGGCLTLNWHPKYLDDPKYRNVYVAILEEAHRRNAWGCSVGELYHWWQKREQKVHFPLLADDGVAVVKS